jgi:hypothetical protein
LAFSNGFEFVEKVLTNRSKINAFKDFELDYFFKTLTSVKIQNGGDNAFFNLKFLK